jgi:molecular chaperone GrpE (heat shock protein)
MQTEDQTNPLQSASPTDIEQAHTPAEISTESGTEQPALSTEQPQEAPKPKTDWAQRRIDQLTREKHEERRQREALAAELAQYRQPTDQQHQPGQPQDIDQIVEQRVAAKISDQNFNQACNRVYQAGVKADPNFEANLRTLQSVGEISRDFLEVVTDMEEGHKVLNHLGANPDEADRILSLPPLKQARELAKIEASLGKAAPPPPVSKAPAPISPVGSRTTPAEPEEFASTEEYAAWVRQNRK